MGNYVFRIHYSASKKEEFMGVRLKNNSWNGLIGGILKKKYDIGAPIFLNSQREMILEFLKPLAKESYVYVEINII